MITTRTPTAPPQPQRHSHQTLTYQRPGGPVVVDIWEPETPGAVAPVLLVHGWGGSGSYWRQTAQALAATTRVIVPDLPGTGRSQPVRGPQNMYDQVETLAWLLDALEIDRVQIVGHSMGGAMSVLLSAQRPDQVERLVLTALTFFMTKQQEAIYAQVMGFFKVMMLLRHRSFVHVPGLSQMMAQQYFHRLPDDPAVLREGLMEYLRLDRETALACAGNATDAAIREAGAQVTAPTLLIASRQDQMMPMENVDFTLDIIPDSRVRWIEACGHLPMVEKPDAYLALLRDFLVL
ncbi:MAG: alpha/beta hydrolase [Chloroflexi bacterium]|nr:alpha/beta hydrolase [Chloroflexota bacterium]